MGNQVWKLIDFERYPDLEVRVVAPTLEARALLPELVPLFTSSRQQDVVDAVARLAGPFADSLISWTVTNPAGRPIPITRKGVLRVDPWLLAAVLGAWLAQWPPLVEQQPVAEVEPEVDEGLALLATLPMTPLGEESTMDNAGNIPADIPDVDQPALAEVG